MSPANSIRKLGFRRWHERQLIEAHASLITAFLAVIVIAVCLDQFDWRETRMEAVAMLALIAAGLALCVVAARHYFKALFRAEHYAQQAVCSVCKSYGRMEILSENHDDLHVRCRQCGHRWTMHGSDKLPSAGAAL